MFFKKEKKKFVPGMIMGVVAGISIASVAFFAFDKKKMTQLCKAKKRAKAAAGQYMPK